MTVRLSLPAQDQGPAPQATEPTIGFCNIPPSLTTLRA